MTIPKVCEIVRTETNSKIWQLTTICYTKYTLTIIKVYNTKVQRTITNIKFTSSPLNWITKLNTKLIGTIIRCQCYTLDVCYTTTCYTCYSSHKLKKNVSSVNLSLSYVLLCVFSIFCLCMLYVPCLFMIIFTPIPSWWPLPSTSARAPWSSPSSACASWWPLPSACAPWSSPPSTCASWWPPPALFSTLLGETHLLDLRSKSATQPHITLNTCTSIKS